MKVVAKPIEMVSWTDEKENINPVRFRYMHPDESYIIIKIDMVIHKSLEKLAGSPMWLYKCQSIINRSQKIFERTCKWILFKLLKKGG